MLQFLPTSLPLTIPPQKELPPALAALVGSTSQVFVQAIHDLLAPCLAPNPACCLLGDAGCILRPHTAAGGRRDGGMQEAMPASCGLCMLLPAPCFRTGP